MCSPRVYDTLDAFIARPPTPLRAGINRPSRSRASDRRIKRDCDRDARNRIFGRVSTVVNRRQRPSLTRARARQNDAGHARSRQIDLAIIMPAFSTGSDRLF